MWEGEEFLSPTSAAGGKCISLVNLGSMRSGELDGGCSVLRMSCTIPPSQNLFVGTSRVPFLLLRVSKDSGTARRSGEDTMKGSLGIC